MTCAACDNDYHVNCNNWQPVPETARDYEMLETIFGPDVKWCCCHHIEGADE